jgi:hypothetical protein
VDREEVCEGDSGALGGSKAVRAPLTKGSVSGLGCPLAELVAESVEQASDRSWELVG